MRSRRIGLMWLIAFALVACSGEASPTPIAFAPTVESASATSNPIPPSLIVTTIPGTSTIGTTQTKIATPSATIAPSTPVPTTSLARPVPTPSPSGNATPTLYLGSQNAITPLATGQPCNCPTGGAANAPSVPNYQLVEYSCVNNYVMTDWWPSQLFDSDDTYHYIEGSDSTALVYVSANTTVSDNVLTCRISQLWRYQPLAPTLATPSVATPSPLTNFASVGEFSQVSGLPSTEYRDSKTIKQHLGSATDAEQAVWMSRISDEGLPQPNLLIYGANVVQRHDNLQIYLMRLLLNKSTTWYAPLNVTGQYTRRDYLGSIQHFESPASCKDRTGRTPTCRNNNTMLWTMSDNERDVDILYGDGVWERVDSKLGWITYSCLGQNNNPEICAVKSDGTIETPLTNNPKGDFAPRWSPDGSRIAFVSDRDGNQEIYLLGADGIERITFAPGNDSAPVWSTDGKRIAFVSRRDNNAEIYTTLADGREQRVSMATSSPADEDNPTWSPDGRITFDSNRDGQRRIYVTNPGGTVTRLTNGSNDYMPVWSPDGKRIVFVRREISEDLYLINADGTGETRLTTNNYPDHYPVWSPDGKSIAFCIFLPNVAPDTIYIMDIATRKSTLLGDGVLGCPFSWR